MIHKTEKCIGNLEFLNKPSVKQRLLNLQARAEYLHKIWKPEIGESIAGEVLAFNGTRLIVKTIDCDFLNIRVMGDKSFDCVDGKVGDLIAFTYHGDNPPRGFTQYSVIVEEK